MNKSLLKSVSAKWLVISNVGLLLIAFAVFLGLTKSAEMQSGLPDDEQFVVSSSEQNATLGKLSFARTTFFFNSAENTLFPLTPTVPGKSD